jgi:hypothetical protein
MAAEGRVMSATKEILVCSYLAKRLPAAIARVNGGTTPDAVTVGGVTFLFANADDERLRRHEAVHREQQRRMGWLFYPRYLVEHWRHGYAGNKYEVEARAAE